MNPAAKVKVGTGKKIAIAVAKHAELKGGKKRDFHRMVTYTKVAPGRWKLVTDKEQSESRLRIDS